MTKKELPDWELIVNGPKSHADLVLAEIDRCDALHFLKTIERAGLRGDWRRAAVRRRIEELEKTTEEPQRAQRKD